MPAAQMFKFQTRCSNAVARVPWPSVPARRRDRIDRTARDVLGFDALRPGQREAIESVLAGRDTLAVLSTGSAREDTIIRDGSIAAQWFRD